LRNLPIHLFFSAPHNLSTTMTARPRNTDWNEEIHKDIVVALFDVIHPTPSQFTQIMQILQEKGHVFSAGALKYASFFF
jgi:hypothetical protein